MKSLLSTQNQPKRNEITLKKSFNQCIKRNKTEEENESYNKIDIRINKIQQAKNKQYCRNNIKKSYAIQMRQMEIVCGGKGNALLLQ